MNDSVMDLSIVNLAIAYIFVLLLLIIFRARGIRRENMILIATTRMTVQLTIMGYILLYVFKNPSWWLTLLMLLIMLGFAIYNAAKRVRYDMSDDVKRLMGVSMTIGYLFYTDFRYDYRQFHDRYRAGCKPSLCKYAGSPGED